MTDKTTMGEHATAIQNAADAFNAAVKGASDAGYIVRWGMSTQSKLPATISDITVAPPYEWMNE